MRIRELIRRGVDPRLLHDQAVLHGGGKGSPAPPDYSGAAAQQGASAKENLTQQTWANRPEINTPWGSQTWESQQAVDPATGQPVTSWESNITLSPAEQAAATAQQAIQQGRSELAAGQMGRVSADLSKPFDWANLPKVGETPTAGKLTQGKLQTGYDQSGFQSNLGLDTSGLAQTTQASNEPGFIGERQRIENALFERMAPVHQQQEAASRGRLSNMGLSMGSEAYNRELSRLQQGQAGERFNAMQTGGQEQSRLQQMLLANQQQAFGQTAASQSARNAALTSQGQFANQAASSQNAANAQAAAFANQAEQQRFSQEAAAQQQQFGQGMQASAFQNQQRQTAIAEEAQRRGMSLNELNALLTGQQVAMPQGMAGAPNTTAGVAAATPYLGAAQSQGQFNLGAQKSGPDIGSLVGTAASVAPLFMSDRRLKTNVVRIGTHPLGIGIYKYDLFGQRDVGVMADEVLQVKPEAVVRHGSGYLMVNYGRL